MGGYQKFASLVKHVSRHHYSWTREHLDWESAGLAIKEAMQARKSLGLKSTHDLSPFEHFIDYKAVADAQSYQTQQDGIQQDWYHLSHEARVQFGWKETARRSGPAKLRTGRRVDSSSILRESDGQIAPAGMSQQNGFDFNSGENFNLDFSTLDNTDVLENFDFDSFLNTTTDDAFNFNSGMIGGVFSVDAHNDLPANEGLRKEANHNAKAVKSNGNQASEVPGEDVDADGDSEAETMTHKQGKKRGLLADAPISKPLNDAAWPRTYSVGPTRRRRYYCRVPQCRRKPEGFMKFGYYRNHMTSRHQAFIEDHSDWQEAPAYPLSGVSAASSSKPPLLPSPYYSGNGWTYRPQPKQESIGLSGGAVSMELSDEDEGVPRIQPPTMEDIQRMRIMNPKFQQLTDDQIRGALINRQKQQIQAHMQRQTNRPNQATELSNEDNHQINLRAGELAKKTSKAQICQIGERMDPQLRADLQARGVEPIIYYFRMMVTREFRKIQSERQANAAREHVPGFYGNLGQGR